MRGRGRVKQDGRDWMEEVRMMSIYYPYLKLEKSNSVKFRT